MTANDIALFAAVFLACVVEAVEATTIVLAAGTSRSWRSATQGVIAGVILLAVVVAVVGPAIQLLPLDALRLVVGGLLLVFGLQWLRKAVNRSSGYKPLHDEAEIYRRQVEAARAAQTTSKFSVSDWYGFTLSFKGVVLEGLEVVFIVLTFGTNQKNIPVAVLAAAGAIVLVVIMGVAVRGPLSRVPENTMKFVVGIMLTAFGIFWGAEGAGASWPGADLSLLVIAPSVAVFCLILVAGMRSYRRSKGIPAAGEKPSGTATAPAGPSATAPAPAAAASTGGSVTSAAPVATAAPVSTAAPVATAATTAPARRGLGARLAAIGLFLYDFVIGDDWQVAAGVAVGLIVTALLAPAWAGAYIVTAVFAAVLLPYSIRRALR